MDKEFAKLYESIREPIGGRIEKRLADRLVVAGWRGLGDWASSGSGVARANGYGYPSGSVRFHATAGGDPQGLSRAAVEFLLDQLELAHDQDRAAVVLFNSTVNTIPKTGLTTDGEALRKGLTVLSEVKGNTDLEEALHVGLRLLAPSKGRKQIVLISDGKPEPDLTSARIAERFPEQLRQYRKARTDQRRSRVLERIYELSADKIRQSTLGVLKENQIEIYPIALTGIQAPGEELLRQMARQVTQDEQAFIRIRGRDLVDALDRIIPKPVNLMTIQRARLDRRRGDWSVRFHLDNSLQRVRVLVLFRAAPPPDLTWVLSGPMGTITADQPGAARYLAAKDQNGQGKPVFERLFLDQPKPGDYTLNFRTSSFLPPMQVVVEGRTSLRLAVTAEPDPAEVNLPVTFYCRVDSGPGTQLYSAQGCLVDEQGHSVASSLSFSSGQDQNLQASWVPVRPGQYRLFVRGYLNSGQTRYLTSRYLLRVQPQQAVHLQIEIPVPK